MMGAERTDPDDAGLSLVELIIYMVVLGLLSVGIVTLLVNTWKSQQSVASQTQAVTRAQVFGSMVERAVRDGQKVQVSPDFTAIVVSTGLPGAKACQGFSLGGGKARVITGAAPLGTDTGSWKTFQEGVHDVAGHHYFTVSGLKMTYDFEMTNDSGPVHVSGASTQRVNPTGAGVTCWP